MDMKNDTKKKWTAEELLRCAQVGEPLPERGSPMAVFKARDLAASMGLTTAYKRLCELSVGNARIAGGNKRIEVGDVRTLTAHKHKTAREGRSTVLLTLPDAYPSGTKLRVVFAEDTITITRAPKE